MNILFVYLLAVNVAAFLMMGADKKRAIQQRRRIPEKTLLLTALVGGSLGAYMGMQSFRHKTKHLKFSIGLPAMVVLHLALGAWLLFG
jgi:uncharacterized membrane protein YsdA (DUF1294 family)